MVYTVYSLTSGLPGPAAAQAGRPAPGLTGSAPPPPIRVLLQRGHRRIPPSVHFSISSNHPGAKSVVHHGI